MFLIKTELRKSKIHGVGVFALQAVKKGAVVWKWRTPIDKAFTKRQYKAMSSSDKKFLDYWLTWKTMFTNYAETMQE